ncbi:hypothetical protein [Photobacterium angustum]|uniref:hypothetical protein n=2 Tax=Photobacterium angustum TaxID=661 RepID=UPI0005E85B31|nr:hypothetical protein [Photobacterium angustum]KJF95568.1 hypothetical protein UB39_05760 [Photobacterium angustum]PSV95754.1 hypothetical protein CTN01_02720 [Photobacterium angustum]PSW82979.1 hypothetical protein CTN03_00635 [Photobacterium angustum]
MSTFTIAPVYLVNNNAKKMRYAQAEIPPTQPRVNQENSEKKASTITTFSGYDNRGEIQPKASTKGCTININV